MLAACLAVAAWSPHPGKSAYPACMATPWKPSLPALSPFLLPKLGKQDTLAAVQAAIERAQSEVSENGMFLECSVIPSPDKRLWDSIL